MAHKEPYKTFTLSCGWVLPKPKCINFWSVCKNSSTMKTMKSLLNLVMPCIPKSKEKPSSAVFPMVCIVRDNLSTTVKSKARTLYQNHWGKLSSGKFWAWKSGGSTSSTIMFNVCITVKRISWVLIGHWPSAQGIRWC